MNANPIVDASLEIFAATIMLVLVVVGLASRKRYRMLNIYLLLCYISHFLMLLCDIGCWLINGGWLEPNMHKTLWILRYSLFAISVFLFGCYLMSFIAKNVTAPIIFVKIQIPIVIYMIISWTVSMNNGMFYSLDDFGNFSYGQYHIFSLLPGMIMIAIDMFVTVFYRKYLGMGETIAFLCYGLLPLAALPLQLVWSMTPLYLAITVSFFVMYIMINVEQDLEIMEQKVLIADKDKLLAQQKVKLNELSTRVMVSQIQPHFLYNSLNTIYFLCEKDPEQAQEAIDDFSGYLRMNLDSLGQNVPVSFEVEEKHVSTYLKLEKMRFRDKLNIVYDINTRDFKLPVLTLQPIVENAVKYGVGKKSEGGTVKISTNEFEDGYKLIVSDDGIGFDVSEKKADDGRSHTGIQNVRDRLKLMINANLSIDSKPGQGTTVSIWIPKEVK